MWLQIVFKQSTRESKTKLNFGFISQKVLSSLSESNHRCFDEAVDLTALNAFLPALHEIKKACAHSESLPVGFCVCIVCINAGPVLHTGAVTWVMDVAWYLQVICIIFAVAQTYPGNLYFLFSKQQIYLSQNPREDSCPFSSLSDTAGKEKAPSSTLQIHIFSLCSNRPSSALWSTFSADVFPSYVSFSPPPSHYGGSCYPSDVMASCCDAPSGCVWDRVVGWHLAASDKRAREPHCSFWDDFFIYLPARPVARGFRTAYKIIFHYRLQP